MAQQAAPADVLAFIERAKKMPMWVLYCADPTNGPVVYISQNHPFSDDRRLHADSVIRTRPGFLDDVLCEVDRLGLLMRVEDVEQGTQLISFRELPAATARSPFAL